MQNKELSTINSKLSTANKFIKIKKAKYEKNARRVRYV